MKKVRSYHTGVQINDYVLVTKYSDRDLRGPFAVGYLRKKGKDQIGQIFCVYHEDREYRHCWKISREEGVELIAMGEAMNSCYKPLSSIF